MPLHPSKNNTGHCDGGPFHGQMRSWPGKEAPGNRGRYLWSQPNRCWLWSPRAIPDDIISGIEKADQKIEALSQVKAKLFKQAKALGFSHEEVKKIIAARRGKHANNQG